MAEHNIPREKFVVGNGVYSNSLPWEARVTAESFEIVPVEPNWSGPIVVMLFLTVFGILMAFGMVQEGSFMIGLLVLLPTLLGAFFVFFGVSYEHQSAKQRGSVFRYGRHTGQITLPDHELTFEPGNHLRFEFITSPFYSAEGTGELVAELQLVVELDGKTERYVLVRGGDRSTLKPMVAEVHRYVGLPIYEIEHGGFLRPKVYERMFGQD